jgi:hypothetical protein
VTNFPSAIGLTIRNEETPITAHHLEIERLLHIMSTSPDKTALECLEQFKAEFDQGTIERQRQAHQYALEHPTLYGLARYDQRTQVSGGSYVTVKVPIEHVQVAQPDLASWAKSQHIKMSDLTLLLNGDVLEVNNWRAWEAPSWSSSKLYRNREEDIRDRARLLEEDCIEQQHYEQRHQLANRVVRPQLDHPPFRAYKPQEEG